MMGSMDDAPHRTLAFALAAMLVLGVLIGWVGGRASWRGPFPVETFAGTAMISADRDAIFVVDTDGDDPACGGPASPGCGFPLADTDGAQCLEAGREQRVEIGWIPAEASGDRPGLDLLVWVRCLD
jgi:hypothetical protein